MKKAWDIVAMDQRYYLVKEMPVIDAVSFSEFLSVANLYACVTRDAPDSADSACMTSCSAGSSCVTRDTPLVSLS